VPYSKTKGESSYSEKKKDSTDSSEKGDSDYSKRKLDLLDSIGKDLQDFEKDGVTPAKPRLKSLSAALGLYHTCLSDDSENSRKRAKVDGMLDGKPPYDQSKLRAAGQGGRCNLNFGEGQRHIDAAVAGYVDLATSTEFLVDTHAKRGESAGSDVGEKEANAIRNEELTTLIRDWPEWGSRFLSLVTEYLKHGVGSAYYDNHYDWRPQVTGLKDFKFPRNTRSNEEAMDICFARRDYSVAELFKFISNEGAAKTQGWDVEAVRNSICTACRSSKSDKSYDWEHFQQLLKNGDTNAAMETKSVRLVHTWVKETNGEVSHYLWEERHSKLAAKTGDKSHKFQGQNDKFLFKKEFAHKRSEQAFTIFTYGVGNNGTYHSVRGYGHRIFPLVQYLNRLQCQAADAAAISGGILVQPNSMEDLRDMAIQFYGPWNVLRPNVEVVDRKINADLTRNMIPVVQDIRSQLEDTSDFYSTSRASKGSPYRNTLQVRAELESATRLSAANLALFYSSFDRLLREMVRRIVNSPSTDQAVKTFLERCRERGLSDAQIKNIDHTRTKAARAIGAGNPAARIAVLDQLNQERPFMDEVGNRNLTFDRVAARIGHESAVRYVQKDEQPRGSTAQTDAVLENALIKLGQSVPVLPAQLHGNHLELHLPVARQYIDAVVSGQMDPRESLNILQAIGVHVQGHAQPLTADPNQQNLVSQAMDVSNKLSQIIENTERSIEADGGGEGGDAPSDRAAELQQLSQVKQEIMRAESATRQEIKKSEAQQKQRLADFAAANEALRRSEQGDLTGDFGI
jgi:hypothetical protein